MAHAIDNGLVNCLLASPLLEVNCGYSITYCYRHEQKSNYTPTSQVMVIFLIRLSHWVCSTIDNSGRFLGGVGTVEVGHNY